MSNDKPFIHLMKTPYGYYVFDVNTNSILRITQPVYEYLLRKRKREQINANSNIIETIENLKSRGFLLSHKPKEMIHPVNEYLEYYLNNKLRKITLQVTQNCNFRCSYCIYSETDNEMQRTHSNKRMSFGTAKRAIDFFIEHSRDNDSINIGFYGGEPLLEIELIKKCIIYAETISEGKEISFSITTNGSLLKSDLIEFFIKHNVLILISLDGPKQVHDRHRRLSANGCGSFDIVEKNIVNIKKRYPEYLKKISFNVVIDPQDDSKCVNEFFLNYELFKEINVRTSLIDDSYSNEKVYFTEDYVVKDQYEYFKMLLNKFGRVSNTNISPIAEQRFISTENAISNLGEMIKLPDKMSHSGPCIPGVRKLFISVNENMYPCERVSELSEAMKIGNLDDGYNIEKVRNLLNIVKLSEERCKNCWVISNCSICAKYADNIQNLSPELKSSYCNMTRKAFERKLLDYIALKEIGMLINNYIV